MSSTGKKFIFKKSNCCVKWINTVKCWLGVPKEEGDKCVQAVCNFMADTATQPAFDGETSMHDAFKKFTHSNGIDMAEYKYIFGKVWESQLM
eukprot:14591096-Ditylum_brightwellii.AAC.1